MLGTTCPKHGVETRLRCVNCDQPICIRCQVRTAVGLKCEDCAALPARAVRRGRHRSALAMAAGAALAVLAAGFILAPRVLQSRGQAAPAPAVPIGSWKSVPDLGGIRGSTTGTPLPDGGVLVAGGGVGSLPIAASEVFQPGAMTWSRAGDLHQARRGHAAAMLPGGRVLVAGGIAGGQILASAEIYEPAARSWHDAAPMATARLGFTLTTLRDGQVLAAGGVDQSGLRVSAEIFDPATGSWKPVAGGPLQGRYAAAASLLKDGRVLLTGGSPDPGGSAQAFASSELFEPSVGVFTRGPSMAHPRAEHSSTVLADGRVLVAGGASGRDSTASAEIFDPGSGTWSATASMAQPRRLHSAGVLHNGAVLVAGGEQVSAGSRSSLKSVEIYDPRGKWRPAASLACPRSAQYQVTLSDGSVLVAGGDAAFPGEPPRAQSCAEVFSAPAFH